MFVRMAIAGALVLGVKWIGSLCGETAMTVLAVAPILSGYLFCVTTRKSTNEEKERQALWSALGMIPGAIFYLGIAVAPFLGFDPKYAIALGASAWLFSALSLRAFSK